MREKPYHSISIQALTARAGLSRQAFHTNFKRKDDILLRRLLTLLKETLARIQTEQIDTVEQFVRLFTEFVERNASFFRLLADNELGLIKRVYSRCLATLPPVLACQRENRSETECRYFHVFWVTAFIEAYALWLSEDLAADREEIVAIIRDIMRAAISRRGAAHKADHNTRAFSERRSFMSVRRVGILPKAHRCDRASGIGCEYGGYGA